MRVLAFKNRHCHERWVSLSIPPSNCQLMPMSRWALEAVASWWLFQGALNTTFGCIHFIFRQSSFVLKANCLRVNTLDPGRKHLSYIWIVLTFTDQIILAEESLKSDSPTNYPKFLILLTDCDPPSTWRYFFFGIEKSPLIHVLKMIMYIKELKHGWLREKKTRIYGFVCSAFCQPSEEGIQRIIHFSFYLFF